MNLRLEIMKSIVNTCMYNVSTGQILNILSVEDKRLNIEACTHNVRDCSEDCWLQWGEEEPGCSKSICKSAYPLWTLIPMAFSLWHSMNIVTAWGQRDRLNCLGSCGSWWWRSKIICSGTYGYFASNYYMLLKSSCSTDLTPAWSKSICLIFSPNTVAYTNCNSTIWTHLMCFH